MQFIVLYVVTAAIFLVADAIMLNMVMKPLFVRHIGDWVRESPRMGPAVAFYLFYVLGLLIFVSGPALVTGSATQALLYGALLGAIAYGTYEFTNLATLTRWSWGQVAVDFPWGIVLTGGSAWAGVVITRAIFG